MKKCILILFIFIFTLTGCGTELDKQMDKLDESLENSSNEAIKTTVFLLKKEVEYFYLNSVFEGEYFTSDTVFTCGNNECKSDDKKIDLEVVPEAGTIIITENGKVEFKDIVINGYICNAPLDGSVTCTK